MEKFTLLLKNLFGPLLRPASMWLLGPGRRYPTWVYEALVVFVLLVIVAASTTSWSLFRQFEWNAMKPLLANWLAVGAVLGSFLQAQVGFRMAEVQSQQTSPSVHCHLWATRYWIGKEILWASVFLLTGAYPALVGNAVFMVYPAWRQIHLEMRSSKNR